MGLTTTTLCLANEAALAGTVAFVSYHGYKEKLVSMVRRLGGTRNNALLIDTKLTFYEYGFTRTLDEFVVDSGTCMLIIDDLDSLLGETDLDAPSRNKLIEEFRGLANERNICIILNVIVSDKLDFSSAGKRPSLRHFTWSRNLLDAADQIYSLYRPAHYCIVQDEEGYSTKGKLYIDLLKDRALEESHWVISNFRA
jgi:hypothetical protein